MSKEGPSPTKPHHVTTFALKVNLIHQKWQEGKRDLTTSHAI